MTAAEALTAIEREAARGTLDIASNDDRAWFAAHPRRRYRLRRPLPGEHFNWRGDMSRASGVVVRQVASGLRWRLQIDLKQAVGTYGDDEATAQKIFREARRALPSEIRGRMRRIQRLVMGAA